MTKVASSSSSLVLLVLLGLATAVSGFVVPAAGPRSGVLTRMEAGKKINEKIDLESPKVVNTVELAPGDKKVFCRCWLSDTFPLCNGAHQKHNEATGDNVGPLIVAVPKSQ